MPYRSIQDPTKLRRVLEANLLIESYLELPDVLRHVVEEACSMTGARYGALGVLDEEKRALSDFITVGLDREQEEAIGPRPTGRGVLGLLITDPQPLRIANIGEDAESFGFPPNHPPMTSFLGVPIKVRDEVYGNLYLTDKVGCSEFTDDDVALVGALSLAAGIAIENARLHDRVRRGVVYEDRERVARDLHDTVIQRLFALGLTLQGLAARDSNAMLGEAVTELDSIITQIRSTIYELGMVEKSRGFRDEIISLVREMDGVVGFKIAVSFSGLVDAALSDDVVAHLIASIREALTNVGKHAAATRATVEISMDEATCRMQISDNGVGMRHGTADGDGGLGLPNMRRRAEKLGGTMSVEAVPSGGTRLIWEIPIES